MSVFDLELAARALLPKDVLNEASSLRLDMYFGENSVGVSAADVATGHVVWQEDFRQEDFRDPAVQSEFAAARNWADRVFRKCTLAFDSRCFTLVPAPFFDDRESHNLLSFNTGRQVNHTDHVYLPGTDAQLIFETPDELKSLIKKYPNIRILPSSYLLALYAESMAGAADQCFHIYVSHNYMLVCLHLKGKLQLLNYYDIRSETDVLYFISNAVMQFVLDNESLIVNFADVYGHTGLEKLLRTYYSNVHDLRKNRDLNSSQVLTFMNELQIRCV